jgi:PAS domain S-box-containing protein
MELLSLSRTISVEMHDEEIVHAYVSALLRLFPGRLFALRLFDLELGELSLVYATSRLRTDRRERVVVTEGALQAQGFDVPSDSLLQVTQEYTPLFASNAAGFDVALGEGRNVVGVLAVEYAPFAQVPADDAARIVPIALSLASQLRNARLMRESLYLRDHLAKLIEHANAPILVVGKNREIRVVNRALLSLTGYRREELVGRDFTSLVEDEERKRLLPVLIGALRGHSATGVEVRLKSQRGHVRLLMNTASVLSADGEVEGVIAIGRDLTEIRELERRIVHAEKLASVGQLAAGVVHELNNPLTSISVYSNYLLKQAEQHNLPASDVLKLKRIHESADRILRFTRELLAYAKPTAEEPKELLLSQVIARAMEYCEHLVSERAVEVRIEIASDLPAMLGVSGQLQQVMVNLITNACHAMPEGVGVLTLKALASDAGALVLKVRDNGVGISPDHLSRIFEPFFSTKGEGHGTGLGLCIVRNIVELHGGSIDVESELGHGTTFRLVFPVPFDPTRSRDVRH